MTAPYALHVSPFHISEVHALFEQVRFELALRGLDLWQHGYPDLDLIERDVLAGGTYGHWENERLLAVVTLDFQQAPQYDNITWPYASERPLVVHRLAVLPTAQGRGHGGRMMDFAEDLAAERNATSIRLDTYTPNARNMAFYDKRGYTRAEGQVYFPPQSEGFACFEMALD